MWLVLGPQAVAVVAAAAAAMLTRKPTSWAARRPRREVGPASGAVHAILLGRPTIQAHHCPGAGMVACHPRGGPRLPVTASMTRAREAALQPREARQQGLQVKEVPEMDLVAGNKVQSPGAICCGWHCGSSVTT